MTERHPFVRNVLNYRCPKAKLIANPTGKDSIDEFDNSELIDMILEDKVGPIDERLAAKSIQSGNKNKRAIEGAVRATRDQFHAHFDDELEEHSKREWWGDFEYPVDESTHEEYAGIREPEKVSVKKTHEYVHTHHENNEKPLYPNDSGSRQTWFSKLTYFQDNAASF